MGLHKDLRKAINGAAILARNSWFKEVEAGWSLSLWGSQKVLQFASLTWSLILLSYRYCIPCYNSICMSKGGITSLHIRLEKSKDYRDHNSNSNTKVPHCQQLSHLNQFAILQSHLFMLCNIPRKWSCQWGSTNSNWRTLLKINSQTAVLGQWLGHRKHLTPAFKKIGDGERKNKWEL